MPAASSTPEIADRHRRLIVWGVLLLGSSYGISVLGYFTGATALDRISDGLVLLALVLIGTVMVWKVRHLSPQQRSRYFDEQGYVAEVFRRAQLASWGTTVLVLVSGAAFGDRFDGVPATIVLKSAAAVMLVVFAMVFLAIDREPGPPEASPSDPIDDGSEATSRA